MTKLGNSEYPVNHEGQSCIVCGSAPSLLKDYETAKAHMPDAVVIGVNESVAGVWCDHLATYHFDRIPYFINVSLNKDIIVHSACPNPTEFKDRFHYLWDDCMTAGTSGMGAMMVAMRMGFSEIVLCGMPMNPGTGYFNDDWTLRKEGQPRFGYMKSDHPQAGGHQRGFLEGLEKYPRLREISRSMGGFTADVLGVPSWLQQT